MAETEDIKARIDVVDFIGKYLPLKKAGANYRGLCPFHGEKTPSFMVSADKQIWHCFGCGRGGDVFKFVMEKEGISFPEALAMLADQAGVTLSKVATGGVDKRKSLLTINDLAAKFYSKILQESDAGRVAQDYLIGRGLTPETIAEFRVGYAPGGHVLVDFLKKRGVAEDDIEKAGLAVRKGSFLQDKFSARVMFPICDALGRVVAFTGRVLDANSIPKYLNSPETPVFKKGEVLFGLNLAKPHIQEAGYVVMVEGQMDMISSYQVGVKNVVATSGTAITEMQLQLLRRYATELVLALDADKAGVDATKRVFETASKLELGVKVALLGEAKDPDVLIKKDGEWAAAIAGAVPMMDFYFTTAIAGHDSTTLAGRKALTKEVLPVVSLIQDPVERDHYLKKLAALVGVETRALYDALKRPAAKTPFAPARPTQTVGGDQLSPSWLEERILAIVLWKPELLPGALPHMKDLKWASGLANTIYQAIVACYTSPDLFSLQVLLDRLPDYDRTALLELLLVVEESYADSTNDDLAREVALYAQILQKRSLQAKRQELVLEIAQAEKAEDRGRLEQLLNQLRELE